MKKTVRVISNLTQPYSRSVYFPGVDEYLDAPAVAGVSAMSFWLNSADTFGNKYLIEARPGLPNGYFLSSVIGPGLAEVYCNNALFDVNSWNTVITDKGWVLFYILFSQVTNGGIRFMANSIGTQPLAASLADLRYYDANLSPAHRLKLITDPFFEASETILKYNFREPSGATVLDSIGSNHGTLYNGPVRVDL